MKADSRPQSDYTEPLPPDFTPGNNDCICGRGSTRHEGNIRFNKIVKDRLNRYSEAITNFEKTLIVTEIVQQVREGSPVGGFVKKCGDRWYRAREQLAREKAGHMLRNLLCDKYKSSNKAKKARREAYESQFDEGVDIIMNQLHCIDISKRVSQLTVNAKADDDLQMAFNRANSELLDELNNSHLRSVNLLLLGLIAPK